jgi:hypothetical protein
MSDAEADLEIQCDFEGRTYSWSLDTDSWFGSLSAIHPPRGMQMQITAAFLLKGAKAFRIAHTTNDDQKDGVFLKACCGMGATQDQLIEIGFVGHLMEKDPKCVARYLMGRVGFPGNSFLNVTWLRDRFFEGRVFNIEHAVCSIGDGPFVGEDLSHFLFFHGITIEEESDEANIVVLGRTGWAPEKIDDLIDSRCGRRLRIYSQEMFLSVLAGQPDPFETTNGYRVFEFEAFRADHPGLQYVSDGWGGWVHGNVADGWASGGGSGVKLAQADESPLKLMGYQVGSRGVVQESRREILQEALQGDLPFVSSAGYMEEWGASNSARRLRRIAEQLASYIRKTASRRNADSYREAIEDWQSDLAWLREKHYRGRFAFDWPNP